MNKPTPIILDNETVYEAEQLYKYDTLFFHGCARIRTIIDKKRLTDDDYIFGYIKDNKWIKSTKTYQKAKLLIKEEWVFKNIPKFMNEVNKDAYQYEEAPEILELTNEEKFKDINGKIIEIEVRGERKYNNCYFKVKDVMIQFEMPNLNKTITHLENNEYKKNLHYKTFIVNNVDIQQLPSSKKYLYLTYNGILKVLFSSRSGNAELFQNWATEKLFTVHLGIQEDKEILSSELLGVNAKTIKDIFKTNSSKTPCVYLYFICNAKELLTGDYNDDDILCKYGCTDDLERRCSEHHRKYKKDFNTNIELICFSIIESKYIFDAETNITQYFKSNIIEYNNSKELIIINKKDISQIKQHYKMIQNSYIGRYEEMQNKIIQLEKDIIELNNKLILQSKEIELINEKHKNELKDKDIELLNYKIKLLEK
jgi:hypothetical protein